MKLKKCTKCGEKFPPTLEYFYRHCRTKDKLRPQCKGCVNKCNKKYRNVHRKELLEKNKSNYYSNWEENKKKRRDYYWSDIKKERRRSREQARKPSSKQSTRSKYLMQKYGITEEDYKCMLKEQNGVCAICKKPPKINRNFDIDHDHKIQREEGRIYIRGLLCSRCNHYVMGIMRDNKEIFKGVIKYLQKALKNDQKWE